MFQLLLIFFIDIIISVTSSTQIACDVICVQQYNMYRSSQRRCSLKEGVLKNFANFTGKQLCWSLYLYSLYLYISRLVTAISTFRSSCPELFCKIGVLKNFAKFADVSSGTGVSCEFCEILPDFRKTPTVAASGICTNRDILI